MKWWARIKLYWRLGDLDYRIAWVNSELASLDIIESQIKAERHRLLKALADLRIRRGRASIEQTFGV